MIFYYSDPIFVFFKLNMLGGFAEQIGNCVDCRFRTIFERKDRSLEIQNPPPEKPNRL